MAILQSGSSPGQRIEAGNTVLDRAKGANTAPVKKRLGEFTKEHRAYEKGHKAASKAREALFAQERKLGEGDAGQDVALDKLASALVGAGAPRNRPLAGLETRSVSELKKLPTLEEANALIRLAGKCAKHPDGKVKKAAAACRTAAQAVIAASKPLATLARNFQAAAGARDAIAPRWEKAFAALKQGARSAEHDGATDLLAALFEVAAARVKPRKKKPVEGA